MSLEVDLLSGVFSAVGDITVLGAASTAGGSGFTGAGCFGTGGSVLMGSVFPALGGLFTFPESGTWLLSGNQKHPFRGIEKASLTASQLATIASFPNFIYENATHSLIGLRSFTLNVHSCTTIRGEL